MYRVPVKSGAPACKRELLKATSSPTFGRIRSWCSSKRVPPPSYSLSSFNAKVRDQSPSSVCRGRKRCPCVASYFTMNASWTLISCTATPGIALLSNGQIVLTINSFQASISSGMSWMGKSVVGTARCRRLLQPLALFARHSSAILTQRCTTHR